MALRKGIHLGAKMKWIADLRSTGAAMTKWISIIGKDNLSAILLQPEPFAVLFMIENSVQ